MAYQFTQKSGLRKGQKYNVKRGDSGLPVRVYETGDTTLPKGKPSKYMPGLGGRSLPGSQGPPPGYNTGSPAPSGTLNKRFTSDSAVSQVTPRKGAIKDQIARVKDPNPFKASKQPAPNLTKVREQLLKAKVEEFAKRKKPRRPGPAKY